MKRLAILATSLLFSMSAYSFGLVADTGTVYPLFAGTVSNTGIEPICPTGSAEQTAYAKYVSVESENGVRIKYKGLDMIFVEIGTRVDTSISIGHIISTPQIKPPLYLEMQHTDGHFISVPSLCSKK